MIFFVENMGFFLSKLKMCNKTKKAPVQEFLKQRRLLCRNFFWLEETTKFLVRQQKSSFKDWTSFCVREMNFIFACSVLASNLACS